MGVDVGVEDGSRIEVTFEEVNNENINIELIDNPVTIELDTPGNVQVSFNEQYSDVNVILDHDKQINRNLGKQHTAETIQESITKRFTSDTEISNLEPKRGTDEFYVTNAEKTQGGLATGVAELPTINDVTTTTIKNTDTIKVVCLGDSLTEGNLIGGQYSYCNFNQFLSNEAINCGIGGTTLSTHQNSHYAPFSITELVKAIVDNVWTTQDAEATFLAGVGDDNRPIIEKLKNINWNTVTDLTIFSGTNDFGISLPNEIGDVTSTSNYTMYGALKYIINKFCTAYPTIKVHFITPIFRSRIVFGDSKDSDSNINSIGWLLSDYVNSIIDYCNISHTHCIDLHHISGINKYTAPSLLQDGLHPNEFGAKLLSTVLWRSLKNHSNNTYYNNKKILKYIVPSNDNNISINTDNLGRLLETNNLKDIILIIDGECTTTGSGALKIALNGVNTGYNTTGFGDIDGFAMSVDGILDVECYLRITKNLNYKIEGYRAATLNPQVNPATQNLKGKNLSITDTIKSIIIFSANKTIKLGTIIEIWKRY